MKIGGVEQVQIGTLVEWESTSGGSTTAKRGRVVEVLLPWERPNRARFPKFYAGSVPGLGRDHVSYIVEVVSGKTGKTIKHYWPRVSALRIVEEF